MLTRHCTAASSMTCEYHGANLPVRDMGTMGSVTPAQRLEAVLTAFSNPEADPVATK